MWLKNNGFYMAELLLSLSGWILIAGVLVPMFIQLNKQSIQLQERSDALHILYDYLQTIVVENPDRENVVVTRGHTQYEIVWRGASAEGKTEVAISYEDVFGHTVYYYETVQ
jgi:competence protein ComGE